MKMQELFKKKWNFNDRTGK